ncbi:MAG: hypothetical protein R2751_19790 [Bacteroidales bacterium]
MKEHFSSEYLRSTLDACKLHQKWMEYAKKELLGLSPFTADVLRGMKEEQVSLCDQLIFRFASLQDGMGRKLFPGMLASLAEDVEHLPFLDVQNRMEKLGLVESQRWLLLREIRNLVAHEYPGNDTERSQGLNALLQECEYLSATLEKIHIFLLNRALI